jgi:hypothetical protein
MEFFKVKKYGFNTRCSFLHTSKFKDPFLQKMFTQLVNICAQSGQAIKLLIFRSHNLPDNIYLMRVDCARWCL